MSTTPPPNDAVRSYLIAQLQRDPAVHAPAIMRARTKALKLNKTNGGAVDVEAQRKRWNKAKESLDALRKRIWTAPLPELEQELAKLPTAAFPDVAHAAERLRTVLANRSKLPALTQHKDFWADFFNVFKEILVATPQEVAVLREKCVSQFRVSRHKRRGNRMINLLRREVPDLYVLEADWLQTLQRQKASSGWFDRPVTVEGASHVPGWVYILLVIAAVRLLGMLFSG